jgi:ribosome-associated protein
MEISKLIKELQYNFVRSSGAGGQHVNKVSTKAVLSFDLINSKALSDDEKSLITNKLSTKISKEGIISISSSVTRSQLKNKVMVTERFVSIIQQALTEQKERKPTKRPKSANLKRLQKKKNRAQTKANRQKPKLD